MPYKDPEKRRAYGRHLRAIITLTFATDRNPGDVAWAVERALTDAVGVPWPLERVHADLKRIDDGELHPVEARIRCRHRTQVELERRIAELELRIGAVCVDADRRETAALDAAMDCEQHGKTIRHLTEQTHRFWRETERADDASWAALRAIAEKTRETERSGAREIPLSAVQEILAAADKARTQRMRRPIPAFRCEHETGGTLFEDET